jgi:hypothetical protein
MTVVPRLSLLSISARVLFDPRPDAGAYFVLGPREPLYRETYVSMIAADCRKSFSV